MTPSIDHDGVSFKGATSTNSNKPRMMSGKDGACPVCGRSHDTDCRWHSDMGTVFCHTKGAGGTSSISCPPDSVPGNGGNYVYKEPASDGRTGKYVLKAERFKKEVRPEGKIDYFYQDANGIDLIKVTRTDNGDGTKRFSQIYFDPGQGEWEKYAKDGKNTKGRVTYKSSFPDSLKESLKSQAPLYNLPVVSAAIADDKDIWIVEGEDCVKSVASIGIVATTLIAGAGKFKAYNPSALEVLHGARVVLCPDRDQKGLDHMKEVAATLEGRAEIRWCYVKPEHTAFWFDLQKDGGLDCKDWLDEIEPLDNEKKLAKLYDAVRDEKDWGAIKSKSALSAKVPAMSDEEVGEAVLQLAEKTLRSVEWSDSANLMALSFEGLTPIEVHLKLISMRLLWRAGFGGAWKIFVSKFEELSPKDFLFELPTYWLEVANHSKKIELAQDLAKLAFLLMSAHERASLWDLAKKGLKMTDKQVKDIAKEVFATSDEGRAQAQEVAGRAEEREVVEYDKYRMALEAATLDHHLNIHLFQEGRGDYAAIDSSYYRYSEGEGVWKHQPDVDIQKLISNESKKVYKLKKKKDGSAVKIFDCATNNGVKNAFAFNAIQLSVPIDDRSGSENLINFKNGVLDPVSNIFRESHRKEEYLTHQIEADYISNQPCPQVFLDFVELCFGLDQLNDLRAATQYLINPSLPYGKFINIKGPSGSGKGAIIRLWGKIFGKSFRSLSDTAFPKISTPEGIHQHLTAARFVAFADVAAAIKSLGSFYELVDNGPQSGRPLFSSSAYSKVWNLRFAIGSTQEIQFEDSNRGYGRRSWDFTTKDRVGDIDPTIESKLEACIPPLVSWAMVLPAQEVIKAMFQSTPQSSKIKDAQAIASDSIAAFIDACLFPDEATYPTEKSNIYQQYQIYCKTTNLYPKSFNKFCSGLKSIIGSKYEIPRSSKSANGVKQNISALFCGVATIDGLFPPVEQVGAYVPTINATRLSEGGLEAFRDAGKTKEEETPIVTTEEDASTQPIATDEENTLTQPTETEQVATIDESPPTQIEVTPYKPDITSTARRIAPGTNVLYMGDRYRMYKGESLIVESISSGMATCVRPGGGKTTGLYLGELAIEA